MLLPADLRQKLSPDYVNCLDPTKKREVLALLEELRNFENRRSLTNWSRLVGYEPAAHHRLLIEKLRGGRVRSDTPVGSIHATRIGQIDL